MIDGKAFRFFLGIVAALLLVASAPAPEMEIHDE
jgi:hypothetical protein